MLRKERVYRHGDHRVVKRFAWYPRACRRKWDNRVDTEWRWLETVYILQRWNASWEAWWTNVEFVTKAEYLKHQEETKAILAGEHPPYGNGKDRFY